MNRKPKVGDIGIPTKTYMGLSDFGASGLTFPCSYYTKGNQYIVLETYDFDRCIVIDSDDGRMGLSAEDFNFYTEDELNKNNII